MEVLIIGKQPEKWATQTCKECGEKFEVYKKDIERGKGKFCSISCSTTYRNKHNNPAKDENVREKISKNHADFTGENNPMYGKTGKKAPGYIDGRDKFEGDPWRKKAFANKEIKCEICGKTGEKSLFDVHHVDGNRENNNLDNLKILCKSCHYNKAHNYKRDSKGRFKEVVGNAR